MRNIIIFRAVLICLLFPGLGTYAQSHQLQYYSIFDEVTGRENSGLFNGVKYVEQYRTINEKHQFFLTRDFVKGFLLYNDQLFPNVEIKYNVHSDVLLAKAQQEKGTTILQLISEKVEAFEILDHLFVNLKSLEAQRDGVHGFHEQLLKNDLLGLYIKYSRQINERRDNNILFYEFEDEKNDHILYYDGAYHEAGSRRDITRLFPELKQEIKQFYRSNRSVRKSNRDRFMILLFEEITSALTKENVLTK